jgi:ribosomal protein L40E
MADDTVVTLAYAALVVLGAIIAITIVRLFLILLKRSGSKSARNASDEKRINAESALEAIEITIEKKRAQGYDVSEAEEWLNDAKELFAKNRYTSCLTSLEAAKVSLEAAEKIKVKKVKKEKVTQPKQEKEKPEVKVSESEVKEMKTETQPVEQTSDKKSEEIVQKTEEKEGKTTEVEPMPENKGEQEVDEEEMQRKREAVKKELESTEIPEDEMSTEALIKKKMPKDYLPAKFEIGVAETKIKDAEMHGKDTVVAKRHLAEAKAHFDAGKYTEALGFAVKSKKALGVGSEEHIPLEQKETEVVSGEQSEESEVIEVTVESGENICLNCGAKIKPGDAFCRKCGAKIEVEIYCTKCGTKAEPDDMFCGKCGTKLRKS